MLGTDEVGFTLASVATLAFLKSELVKKHLGLLNVALLTTETIPGVADNFVVGVDVETGVAKTFGDVSWRLDEVDLVHTVLQLIIGDLLLGHGVGWG